MGFPLKLWMPDPELEEGSMRYQEQTKPRHHRGFITNFLFKSYLKESNWFLVVRDQHVFYNTVMI